MHDLPAQCLKPRISGYPVSLIEDQESGETSRLLTSQDIAVELDDDELSKCCLYLVARKLIELKDYTFAQHCLERSGLSVIRKQPELEKRCELRNQ